MITRRKQVCQQKGGFYMPVLWPSTARPCINKLKRRLSAKYCGWKMTTRNCSTLINRKVMNFKEVKWKNVLVLVSRFIGLWKIGWYAAGQFYRGLPLISYNLCCLFSPFWSHSVILAWLLSLIAWLRSTAMLHSMPAVWPQANGGGVTSTE